MSNKPITKIYITNNPLRTISFFILGICRKAMRLFVMRTSNSNRVLFIRLDHIGDVICSIPAIESYFAKNITEEIDFLVDKSIKSLLINTQIPAKLIGYQEHSFFNLIKILRKKKYSKIFVLHTLPSFKVATLLLFLPKPECTGLAYNFPGDHLLDKKIPYPKHVSGKYVFEGDSVYHIVTYPERTTSPYPAYLGRKTNTPYVPIQQISNSDTIKLGIFSCVSNQESRRLWPQENYAKLINKLSEKCTIDFFFIGSKNEYSYNNDIALQIDPRFKTHCFNLCGTIPLCDLIESIRSLDFILTVASGLTHIGMALRKPMVILSGPTNTNRWTREEYLNSVASTNLSCQPCEDTTIRPGNCILIDQFSCIKKLELSTVYAMLLNHYTLIKQKKIK